MENIVAEKEDTAYQKKFRAAMKKFGITNPSQLKGEKKKKFFDFVDASHDAGKNETDIDESAVEEGLIRSTKRQLRRTARSAGTVAKVGAAAAAAGAAYGAYKAGRYAVKSASASGRAQLRREKGEKEAEKTSRHLSDVERYKSARKFTSGAKKEIGKLEKERQRTKNYESIMHFTDFIAEKAVSQAQQQAAGAALAAKRKGEEPSNPVAKQMAKMSMKDLEKFAKTKHKDLPTHKEEKEMENDPCWDGYKMVGMKKDEKGNEVPNCVPIKEDVQEAVEVDGRKKAFKDTMKRISERKTKKDKSAIQNKIVINPVIENLQKIYNNRQNNETNTDNNVLEQDILKYIIEAVTATAIGMDSMHDAHGETISGPLTAAHIARALRVSPSMVQQALDDMVNNGTVIRMGDVYTYPQEVQEELQLHSDVQTIIDVVTQLQEAKKKDELIEHFNVDNLFEADFMNRVTDYFSSDQGKGFLSKVFNVASIGLNVKLVYDFAKAVVQKDPVKIFTLGIALLPMMMQMMERLRLEMRKRGLYNLDQEFQQRLRQAGIVKM